MLKEVGKVTGM